MRKQLWLALLLAAAGVILSPARASAQSGITAQNGRRLTCASDDGKRHVCRVDTSRGVQMVNQRSGSPCVQGQTWGYDRRGVWVDRGCRADFELAGGGPGNRPGPSPGAGPGGGPGGGPGYGRPPAAIRITCASNNGKRNVCPVNTRWGVQLVNQRSGSPCVQGRTWGYDKRSVWVDRGCRADFSVARR